MRLSFAPIVSALALLAHTAVVPSIELGRRSLVTDIGNLIYELEEGLGIIEFEAALDILTGGKLVEFENKLGITFAEKMLGLYEGDADPGLIQYIGTAVVLFLDGFGLEQIDDWLVNVTNGEILTFENITGIADIRAALGIEQPGDSD